MGAAGVIFTDFMAGSITHFGIRKASFYGENGGQEKETQESTMGLCF